jgi:TetR/AcrR family transcriptional regulator, transcriptional repressor for nem operon
MARTREFDTDQAVSAAVSTFRGKGFAGSSIQDLVDATGVGRGSLYAAFGDKDGLYLAAVDRYRRDYAEPLLALLASGAPPRILVREVLLGLIEEVLRDGERQTCLIVSAAVERFHGDAQVGQRVRETTSALEDAFTRLLADGQGRGEVNAERDPRDLARFLIATIHGIRVAGAINPDRRWLTSVAEVAMAALD